MSNLTARALPHNSTAKHRASEQTVDECVNMCQALPPSEISSFSGFIGKDQTLRSVLEHDWDFVHMELNSTHTEIAGHLSAMLSDPACHHTAKSLTSPCEITYDARHLPGNTIAQPFGPQKIAVVQMVTNGCQCSMFWNYHSPTTDWGNDGWACTYTLTNVRTGVSIPSIVSIRVVENLESQLFTVRSRSSPGRFNEICLLAQAFVVFLLLLYKNHTPHADSLFAGSQLRNTHQWHTGLDPRTRLL